MNPNTVHRLENISKSLADIREMEALYMPLVQHLLPLHRELTMQGNQPSTVCLNSKDWPKQFEKNIDRACGFDIQWAI